MTALFSVLVCSELVDPLFFRVFVSFAWMLVFLGQQFCFETQCLGGLDDHGNRFGGTFGPATVSVSAKHGTRYFLFRKKRIGRAIGKVLDGYIAVPQVTFHLDGWDQCVLVGQEDDRRDVQLLHKETYMRPRERPLDGPIDDHVGPDHVRDRAGVGTHVHELFRQVWDVQTKTNGVEE
jgi:hypothetical protein